LWTACAAPASRHRPAGFVAVFDDTREMYRFFSYAQLCCGRPSLHACIRTGVVATGMAEPASRQR